MFRLLVFITVTSLFNVSFCHVIWDTAQTLQPVHGLYVKPSVDGTTGDLYVAASEDSGIKSQWLTDQPVNFLPAATQNQAHALPISYTSSLTKTSSPNEETMTKQRQAVVTSPPITFAYAIPVPAAEGNFMPQYPYAIPANPQYEGSKIPYCSDNHIQPYPPFHYFYPPIMSAITDAMNHLKENANNEVLQNHSPVTPSYWPSYGYPYQYVMVDPNWTQKENNPTTTSTTSSENA